MKTKAERRKNDYKHIERKKQILKNVYQDENAFTHGGQFHRLSKGKIHCSCPLCSAKTRGELTHSDKIKMDSMDYKLKEEREEI